jgi:IS605 OrfB family transposase
VKAIKAVSFAYTQTAATRELLETFRMMVNHAIHVCLDENIKGRLRLRDRIYREFRERYQVSSAYPYSVAEVAWSIVKKHKRWHRRPHAKRLMMKLDAQVYSLDYAILSLPFRTGQPRLLVPLHYGDYQRSFLMESSLKRGSVTITETRVAIAFSKEVEPFQPKSLLGIDLNEKSAVCSDGARINLSEVARLHTLYGVRRSSFYARHPHDRRLKKKFAGSRREKERVKQFLQKEAKRIVEKARRESNGIILERLKGIRCAHRKGNGEGANRRRRIALWPFRQFQGYIEYKARWQGVPTEYVGAAYTSQTCHHCRFVNRKLKLTDREWQCPACGAILDRDLNAAINIERRGTIRCLPIMVQAGARDKYEAMKQEPRRQETAGNPVAEVPKLSLRRMER